MQSVFYTFTGFLYADVTMCTNCRLPGRCTGPTDSQCPSHRAAGRPPKLSLESRFHFPALLGLKLSPEPLRDPLVSYDRRSGLLVSLLWCPLGLVSLWCPGDLSDRERLLVSLSSRPPSPPASHQTSQAVDFSVFTMSYYCHYWLKRSLEEDENHTGPHRNSPCYVHATRLKILQGEELSRIYSKFLLSTKTSQISSFNSLPKQKSSEISLT